MSDEEGSGDERKKKLEDPMPEFKMRFTDMPKPVVEKAIRCKFFLFFYQFFYSDL